MTCGLPRLRRFAIAAGLVALTLAADVPGSPRPVYAAGIVVNTLADASPPAADGLCSLREAIANANANAATWPDCPAGTGTDTITFSESGTIVLAAALPDITDAAGLTIDGSGQSVTVSGNNAVRPFTVGGGADATLRQLSVVNGTPPGFSEGGGIRNFGTLTVTNSTITGNGAEGGGGGIFNSGTATVARSTIRGNHAPGLTGGGGIYNSGTLTVLYSTLEANRGIVGGGVRNAGLLRVLASTLSLNEAAAGGGGVSHDGAELVMANTTITTNRAVIGGAMSTFSGSILLISSTLTANRADIASGVYSAGGSLAALNVVVADHAGGDCQGRIELLGPNLIGDPTGCTITGTPPITGDPNLGPLADNGGPTQTHALLPGSPAIDAADDAVCAAAPVGAKDQRGVIRPQGPHCDLGSFERQATDPVPLLNGDFEAGAAGWTLTGVLEGIARVETEGACFGANNTRGITFNGTRALNVRSSPPAPLGSTGSATSSPFTLGSKLQFRALAENDDAIPAPAPVSFEVVIRTVAGAELAVHAVKPNVLTTSPGTSNDGCLVGDPRDGPWSSHSIDTAALAGQLGRVEFRQHTNVPGKGFFTLVDDVAVRP